MMILLLFLAFMPEISSASDYIAPLQHDMRCRGCDIVGDSIYKELLKVYRKTKGDTILVGHRMQSNSKQARKKKYFGSEAMADDVLEGVCTRVSTMGDELLGKGHPMSASEVSRYESSLENYCQTLIEEYEDELKERLFSKDIMKPKGVNKWLCVDRAEICNSDHFAAQERQKDMEEKEESKEDASAEDADESKGDSEADGDGYEDVTAKYLNTGKVKEDLANAGSNFKDEV